MKRIALAMGLSDYYDHGIARGIVRYAKTKPSWQLYGHGWMFSPLENLAHWDGDGVITRIEYQSEAALFERLDCPVVDVANAFNLKRVHVVSNSDHATGELAARHFRDNGFSHFAYCGVSPGHWSLQRLQGFQSAVGNATIPVFERPLEWWLDEPYSVDLALFLARLPKPVAIFACNDKVGLRVSSTCAAEGIVVPDMAAILGVDNEDIPCELANPSLSSVALQLEEIGISAATRLDRLMSEGFERVDGLSMAIAPLEVVERRSTSAYATSNPLVVEAFRIIRASGGHLCTASRLVRQLPVSRRSLEIHFKNETGQTLHEALIAQRIRVALRLLRTTNLTMEAVSELAGFGSPQRFFAHFRKQTGTTPNRFRQRYPQST